MRKKRTTYPVKVLVDGKVFRGSEFTREGKYLILKSADSVVYFNMDNAAKPIEVHGASVHVPVNKPVPVNGGPKVAGPMVARFNSNRNAALEAMTALPQGGEEEN